MNKNTIYIRCSTGDQNYWDDSVFFNLLFQYYTIFN